MSITVTVILILELKNDGRNNDYDNQYDDEYKDEDEDKIGNDNVNTDN